jgi:hypothetical protein
MQQFANLLRAACVSDELDVGGTVSELTFLSAIKLNERDSLRPRGKGLR